MSIQFGMRTPPPSQPISRAREIQKQVREELNKALEPSKSPQIPTRTLTRAPAAGEGVYTYASVEATTPNRFNNLQKRNESTYSFEHVVLPEKSNDTELAAAKERIEQRIANHALPIFRQGKGYLNDEAKSGRHLAGWQGWLRFINKLQSN